MLTRSTSCKASAAGASLCLPRSERVPIPFLLGVCHPFLEGVGSTFQKSEGQAQPRVQAVPEFFPDELL